MAVAEAQAGTYLDVGGIRTYYEVEGTGDPLILLHGGLCTIETLGRQRSALAAHYRVFLPERRAHGRTPDVPGPFSYEAMADDTIAFIEAAGIGTAHLVGWSDGAVIGLLVALRRPDLVRSLTLIGQFVNFRGAQPGLVESLDQMTPDAFPPMLRQLYEAVSPDGPEHYPVVFDKIVAMWRIDPAVDEVALVGLTMPVLLLAAENDIVRIEHLIAMRRVIPNAQLGIVPGATHALPMEKPDLVNRLILDFLASDRPSTHAH